MASRIFTAAFPLIFALAYAILLSGCKLPAHPWQFIVIALQSSILAFLTSYLCRTASRLSAAKQTEELIALADNNVSTPLHALRDGIQQLPCAILLVSAKTHGLLFANHAAFQLFGIDWIPCTQTANRRFDELFKFATPNGLNNDKSNPILQAIQLREKITVENLQIGAQCGKTKHVAVTAIPLFDSANECLSIMALIQDTTEHHLQLKRIEEIAYHDPLTGLPNRLSILKRIQESFDRKDEGHFALLFMDFDRFKLINDSLGHEVGDQLLIEMGNRIRHAIRSTDCVCVPARLGGDEFVVLLDDLKDTSLAIQIAERLLNLLVEPYHLAGHSIVSTASIGVVTSSDHLESAADMLRNADLAMYKSKAAGKARFSLFDDSLRREVEQRLQLETELRAGIKYDEFDLDIQSIVELVSRQTVGGEALLRWQHPRLGRISANQFVEVASETGMIVPIGDRILQMACSFASSRTFVAGGWRLHVNISRLQLLLPSLPGLLDETLAKSGLQPNRLVLEIAESSVKDEPEKVIERLHEIKARGIQICLDNFGSGASPLAFLQELPLDFLKLDRSLVHAIETSPESSVLLEALITIANTYRITVIAEGIENEAQVEKLLEVGCEFGQGYAFQRPIPASQFQVNERVSFHSRSSH